MKLLLLLLCVAVYHYCSGYPVSSGEVSEEVLSGYVTAGYLLDTQDETSWKDFLHQYVSSNKSGRMKAAIDSDTSWKDFPYVPLSEDDRMKAVIERIKNRKDWIDSSVVDSGSAWNVGGGYRFRRFRAIAPENRKWIYLGVGVLVFVKIVFICYRCSKNNPVQNRSEK